jgi:hypothetical protein
MPGTAAVRPLASSRLLQQRASLSAAPEGAEALPEGKVKEIKGAEGKGVEGPRVQRVGVARCGRSICRTMTHCGCRARPKSQPIRVNLSESFDLLSPAPVALAQAV